MTRENILYGIIGLMIGAIVGFVFANTLNKSTATPGGGMAAMSNTALGGNPAMPADHPPVGGSGSGSGDGGAGSIAEVSTAIEKARSEPNNYEAQMTAGDLFYQIQRFEEAIKFYETAVKLKPENTEPVIKLANALFDGEKYADAEKYYAQVLEKDPKNLTVRTDLGLTFYLREPRDVQRAIKEYEKSLAIDPNHEITLQNLALAYRDAGDTANLQKTTAKLKAINPNNPALAQIEKK